MIIRKLLGILALAATATASQASAVQASIIQDFNAGPEGFTGVGGSAVTAWRPTGGVGNTGYVQMTDYGGGEMTLVSTPFGNLSSLLGGTLTFDYNAMGHRVANAYVPYDAFGTLRIYSGNLFAAADAIAPIVSDITGTGWHSTSYLFDDALWTGTGLLSSILANVTKISVVTEYNTTVRWPDEVVGIDNFAVNASVAAVPEPATVSLVFAGLAGLGMTLRSKRRKAAR